MSQYDTATSEGMTKRMNELVQGYKARRNWAAITRLTGGSPREDLQDYVPGFDDGEPRRGH